MDLGSGILRPFHARGRWLLAAIPLTFLVTAAVGIVVTLTLSAPRQGPLGRRRRSPRASGCSPSAT